MLSASHTRKGSAPSPGKGHPWMDTVPLPSPERPENSQDELSCICRFCPALENSSPLESGNHFASGSHHS